MSHHKRHAPAFILLEDASSLPLSCAITECISDDIPGCAD